MILKLACVVEGHGEVSAVPILLRRIAQEIGTDVQLKIDNPIRFDRSKIVRPGEVEKVTQLAAAKVGAGGGILILLDADDDCPAELGPKLLQRANSSRADMPIAVVLAAREFEAWIIAGANSIQGRFRDQSYRNLQEVENIRGAKEWLRTRLKNGRYSPTVDQASLTAEFDLHQARAVSPSFDKLWRDVERLFAELAS